MVTIETLRGEKRAAIIELGEKYGVSSIRVFGSVARGVTHESSDVDFVVEFEKGRNLFDLIGLRLDLRELLGVEVDVVPPNSLRYIRTRVLDEAKKI